MLSAGQIPSPGITEAAANDRLFAKIVGDVEALPNMTKNISTPNSPKRAILEVDLERCLKEVSALATRGLQLDETLH